MTPKEIRQRDEAFIKLTEVLDNKYKRLYIQGRQFYAKGTGEVFAPDRFPGECAVVIEYADSIDEARKCTLEDGDVFYVEDYQTSDELCKAIVEEIEDY